MQLTVINSNSNGNAYILHNNEEALLLECGVNFQRVKEALNFNLKKVVGCLVTHEHGDHAAFVNYYMNAGINVWATAGTHNAMGVGHHHRAKVVDYGYVFNIGNFNLKAYKINHDAADPCCYLIRHAECGTVLFLTDTKYCEYNFKGLNNILIEANYCENIINRRVAEGSNPMFLRDRVYNSHMSIDTTVKTLKDYDLSEVNNIVLIHLSKGNSNEADFKKRVQQATGKAVHIANAGLTIDFNIQPF